MARISIEDCLDRVTNRFELVMLVSKRARSLYSGSEPLLQTDNMSVVTALREVAAGKVKFDHEETDDLPVVQIQKSLKG